MDNTLEQIKKTILEMKKIDQEMRNKSNADWEELTKLDQKHTNILKEFVENYSLIDIPRFGEEVSKAAWLLVQHAPKNEIEFMEKYLCLMLSHPDKVSPKNTALLEDRVNMYRERPQIYGSQIISNSEGKMEFYSIANVQEVDKRRFFVGLETLAHYAKRFSPEVRLPKDYKPDPNYS